MKRTGQPQGAKRWHNLSCKAQRKRRPPRFDLTVYLGPMTMDEYVVEAAKFATEMHRVARAMAVPGHTLGHLAEAAQKIGRPRG